MSDGPIGVRGTRWRGPEPSIALPSPTAMAATWDPGLVRRAGNLLAAEARRKGVHVLLAPTINLHRSPLGGRHFECFSEDPLLTGEIGAAYVIGVQEGGVGATVKHFVANDSETDRMTANVVLDQRTLRELYLAPFEHIIEKARPYGVMAAYNSVNGPTMTEHRELLNDVLRGEWGFDGVVVSDWFAARHTTRAAVAGLDVAMPGPATVYGPALAAAVRDGRISEEHVNEHVARVLTLAERVGALGPPAPAVTGEVDGRAVARRMAARSTVLLHDNGVLPLPPEQRIALIGGLAKDPRVMGGGSAQVHPQHAVSPLEGLLAAGAEVTYARGADPSTRFRPAADGFELTATVRDATGRIRAEMPLPDGAIMWHGDMPAELDPADVHSVEISGTFTAPAAGTHRLGIEGAGAFQLTVDGEVLFDDQVPTADITDLAGAIFAPLQHEVAVQLVPGRQITVSLLHTDPPFLNPGFFPAVSFALGHRAPDTVRDPEDLLAEAVEAANQADVAVVVVGTSKDVESEGFDRTSLDPPGRQDELVTRVAAANPNKIVVVNAGAPVPMPWRDDVAAILLTWFPGQEGGHALADLLLGHAEPGGRLPTTWPATLDDCPVTTAAPGDGILHYEDGIRVGYRGWERADTPPAFEFGSGKGYTTWTYEEATRNGDQVTVRVRNSGDRPGREVIQLYLRPETDDPNRPKRWLAGFATAEAAPGASATVVIDVPERSCQIWTDQGWHRPPGAYLIEVSHSLTDTRLTIP
ncbi:glycoside hydrolase family 3 protein [Actinomadura sp. 3N407]|uniref:glycoside hydrolase family 3 protein n=1 Tax=Actinomadura sp. 3N407 TaxID=3457423 RepID=UPI003FCDEE11